MYFWIHLMISKNSLICHLLFYTLIISCRQEVKAPLVEVIDAKDSVVENQDTLIPVITEPSLSTPNRVAWQKPRLIIGLFGSDLKDKVIADIGAGPTGFFTFELAQQGAKVLAIDIDHNALAYIESNKSRLDSAKQSLIQTRLARAEDPNLKIGEIDGALIVNTITYIQNTRRYLESLKAKLKENGRIVIVDFKMKRLPEQIAPPKSQRMHADKIEDILYDLGYKNIVVDDQTLNFQYIITADKKE